MLYDPKWEVEIKADPFSLESLIAWLEKQPKDETYCYDDSGHCLLAQYLISRGKQFCLGDRTVWFTDEPRSRPIPNAFQSTARPGPHTFGDALARARAASR